MDNRLAIYIFFILILHSATLTTQSSSSNDNNWFYKFTYTKNINSQISIDCENNDQIWIGWSHYGTRSNINNNNLNSDLVSINKISINSNDQLFPMENDCWMNFTEKIAEQCNGADHCELSSQPTFIHKCGKISDYLYVSYKCIKEANTFDICKSTVKVFSQEKMQNEQQSFYIKSSEFPVEYSSSLDCSCLISSSNQQILKYEVLWFSLQDNDFLNIFNKNVTGWINPTHEMPIINKNNMIRFMTDDALAYKGFWLKISNRKACKDDWQLVGDNCVKVFSDALDWRSANQKCQLMNGNLLKIDDVVNDLKLTQYMKSFYPEINSYWIGLRKYLDQHNKEKWMWSNNSTTYNDVSWWPWRRVNQTNQQQNQDDSFTTLNKFSVNNCVVKRRNEDGYFTTSCDPSIKNSFICQTSTIYPSFSLKQKSDIRLQCGQTSEIEAELKSIEAKSTTTKLNPILTTSTTPQAIIKSNSINNIILPNFNRQKEKAIIKSTQIFSSSSSKTTKTSTNSQLLNENVLINKSNEYKLNTTILAGIIAGIGMVIVIINLGVLFICRRNLKKFLKSTKQSSNQTKDDMIQEYFEAFNTLHQNNNKGGLGKPPIQSIQQVRTSSMSSGDDSLLGQHESAQLFYNPQHHLNRELTIRQSQSAFKPFAREDQLLVQQLIQQQNQYDKINHHNLLVLNQSKNIMINNDSADQYAHTYECLDSVDLSNRRQTAIHNMNRNYRTMLNNSKNDSNLLQQSTYDMNNEMNSGINLSTSSGSSSSGASSTHQFIKSSNCNNLPENNKFIIQQLQNTAQLVTLNDLKQFNHVIINDHNNQSSTAALLCNLVNGDLVINGSWSPDSAYYSSIPTLTTTTNNYNSFNLPQQQQHIVNNSTFNPNHDEMRSQIV